MTHTITIVSHTHWDREWYQPFQEYRIRLVQLMDRLLDLLDRNPDYRHFTLDGQTILLEDYLEVRPEQEAKLRRFIQEGRLLIGPWYILPDEFLVGPEATIRNLILGERVASRFGERMQVGYVPDSFGHISQLPQILRGFGLDTAVLWRGIGQAPNEFHWQAPDGSKVLVIHLQHGYGNAAHLPDEAQEFSEHLAALADSLARRAATPHLLAMNGTDHLEPMAKLPALIEYADAHLPGTEVRHGTLPQFISAVKAALPQLETRHGELRSAERIHLLPGVFSARMWIKQRNAHCETLLEKWAEPFSALAATYNLKTPTENLNALTWQAWRHLIQNHPHDSICGCSVDAVHKEMDVRFDWVEQIGEEVTRQSLGAIAEAVDVGSLEGAPVVVFNPTAGPRTDLVTASLALPEEVRAIKAVTRAGEQFPAEIVHRGEPGRRTWDLSKEELTSHLHALMSGRWGHDGIQEVKTGVEGTVARIDVELAPLPPVAEAVERGRAIVEELLADEDIERFLVRLHSYPRLDVRFVASDVPGHGYRTFSILPAEAPADVTTEPASPRLENKFFVVEPDPASGTLTLTDKRSGSIYPALHQFVDGGDRGDEYNYCRPENDRLIAAPKEAPIVRRVESGPIRQTLEITQVYQVPASLDNSRSQRAEERIELPITTQVSLIEGVPRVDFRTTVENRARDHRLRVHFPVSVVTGLSQAEGHFDVVARPIVLPQYTEHWLEQPVPTHHQRTFVDVGDGNRGLLVANHGLPEYEVEPAEDGVIVALTLLRCVGWLSRDDMHCRRGHAGPGYATPGAQCSGTHTFEYSLIPHGGGWETAFAQAHAFNAPLRAAAGSPGSGQLPEEMSFVEVVPRGFVLTAIKQAEDGRDLIIRGYNITEEPQEVRIRLAHKVSRALRTRLDEKGGQELPVKASQVRYRAEPKEIVTVRVEP